MQAARLRTAASLLKLCVCVCARARAHACGRVSSRQLPVLEHLAGASGLPGARTRRRMGGMAGGKDMTALMSRKLAAATKAGSSTSSDELGLLVRAIVEPQRHPSMRAPAPETRHKLARTLCWVRSDSRCARAALDATARFAHATERPAPSSMRGPVYEGSTSISDGSCSRDGVSSD